MFTATQLLNTDSVNLTSGTTMGEKHKQTKITDRPFTCDNVTLSFRSL